MNIKALIKEVYSNDIARRYFVMNSFDVLLTILGIIIAFFIAGIAESRLIIISCLGSGIAISVSGFWGAYLTESAERNLEVKNLEKHLLRKLKGTTITDRGKRAILLVGLVNSLLPLMVMLVLLTPFLLPINIMASYNASFIIAFTILLLLGVFISKVSKERLIFSVLKILSAGLIVTLIIYLLELIKVF